MVYIVPYIHIWHERMSQDKRMISIKFYSNSLNSLLIACLIATTYLYDVQKYKILSLSTTINKEIYIWSNSQ